ncbi:MAG: hypothetical protein ACHP91_11175 [Burkholderiales bacterium]
MSERRRDGQRLCAFARAVAVLGLAAASGTALAAAAMCPPALPAQVATVRGAGPVFPADNWWNADISAAPVDAGSASYIAFINNGGTRKLHPDFGGDAGGGEIYGMPYAVVGAGQPKLAVEFGYDDESDGVDHATGAALPFYPIPAQAITQPSWVEGGAPGNVDQRDDADRHLIVVDCAANALYELYNVWYDGANAQWHAGSGAFFDMNVDGRRPDGWTSADAAGLAIFPGLVRYDEAWNDAVADIGHAFRVTVRATNGYVYPASHKAGGTAGALPMGARLRLKTAVGGVDPATRTTDPHVRKIFRAMQQYGLIVADNGSDLYITGTYDTRWDNDILNPAFALLAASDFDVIALGWKPASAPPPPPPPPPGTITVVEFHYAAFDHYFMTADPTEIGILDRGEIAGWTRTGRTFAAWPLAAASGAVVCRFYGDGFARTTHFYTPLSNECAILAHDPVWQFEGDVFRMALPAADGTCVSATIPLYRLYNDGLAGSPNHRHTTDLAVRASMLAAGWVAEGYGPLGVDACVPG